ncbi:SMP-30/gluconolactonase/LRE family protein [Cytophaga aurantiaca]|uniref:SMP-30/gluconolactonase/LRE family protein n=1 Tax=Cytophaga aurantiaca TaxID=29530 RepID=UPI000368DBE0|nr:SMP-30/gluconolactonase/LRE family protein [Cytophaga aurantiaca]
MKNLIWLILLGPIACSQKNIEYKQEKDLYKSENFTDSLFSIGIEGPCYYKGFLYVVNLHKRGNIARVDSNGQVELFVELPEGSIGNGIRFFKGKMFVADYKKHNVLIVDPDTKEISMYAHSDFMNQPNDITIRNSGVIFAADPNWGKSNGKLWSINIDGTTKLLEDRMGTTNGVEISPDGNTLYVNESVQRNVWRYDITPTNELKNKTLFYKFDDFGMDGMRVDSLGNLYITRYGKGTIAVISPLGKLIREIKLIGMKPTNLSFGGKDGKKVFVTMQDTRRIEVFENEVPGKDYVY